MSPEEKQLTEILHQFYKSKESVQISFDDGGIYRLRILSTMHAEEGGDVVADVVATIQPSNRRPPIDWTNAAMNFRLERVSRVNDGDKILFKRSAP